MQLGHDMDGVTVSLTTADEDPVWLAWEVAVHLARLWPVLDAFVALTVDTGQVTIRASATAMEKAALGGTYYAWRAGVTLLNDSRP